MSSCKPWSVVQVGTASFTNVVGMAIITAWLIYRRTHGTDTMNVLHLKLVTHVPCLKTLY